MKKDSIIEINVNKWNRRTKKEQDNALLWAFSLLNSLLDLRKHGISDGFKGVDR